MPRRPTVSRSVRVIDIDYKYYDNLDKSIASDRIRFGDYRMSERTIMGKIEKQYPKRRVISIDKITPVKVRYSMDLKDFIANSKENN